MSNGQENIIVLEQTDSTQSYLKKNLEIAQNSFTIVRAIEQTNGYGRLNRHWQMQKGLDLSFSMTFTRATLQSSDLIALPLLVGLSIAKVLSNVSELQFHLKWPNDILFEGKKIAGILVEQVESAGQNIAIIGIGININSEQFDPELNATSLKLITGKNFNLEELLINISTNLRQDLSAYVLPLSEDFIETYLANSLMLNKQVHFFQGTIKKQGKVVGLASSGALLVEDSSGDTFEIIDEIAFV